MNCLFLIGQKVNQFGVRTHIWNPKAMLTPQRANRVRRTRWVVALQYLFQFAFEPTYTRTLWFFYARFLIQTRGLNISRWCVTAHLILGGEFCGGNSAGLHGASSNSLAHICRIANQGSNSAAFELDVWAIQIQLHLSLTFELYMFELTSPNCKHKVCARISQAQMQRKFSCIWACELQLEFCWVAIHAQMQLQLRWTFGIRTFER